MHSGVGMTSGNVYQVQCDCGAVALKLIGNPDLCGYCHCEDCRELLDVPCYALTAWNRESIQVSKGMGNLKEFPCPGKEMKRYVSRACGTVLYNTNAMHWRLVP